MEKVGFITPNNDLIFMNYYEVENFCKEICFQEENIELFEAFKKDYSYFSPYFDFVMIHKKYLFINCLYNKNYFIMFSNGAYYFSYLVSDNYQDNVNFFEEQQIYENYSDMTSVSDIELNIKAQDVGYDDDCMIDSNVIGMMSMTNVGSNYGSHVVTASTVLNQMLIKSNLIAINYFNFLNDNVIFDETDPIDYLVHYLGFLRVACRETSPLVMGCKKILSDECLEFFKDAVDNGYKPLNVEDTYEYNDDPTLVAKEYVKCTNHNL